MPCLVFRGESNKCLKCTVSSIVDFTSLDVFWTRIEMIDLFSFFVCNILFVW